MALFNINSVVGNRRAANEITGQLPSSFRSFALSQITGHLVNSPKTEYQSIVFDQGWFVEMWKFGEQNSWSFVEFRVMKLGLKSWEIIAILRQGN